MLRAGMKGPPAVDCAGSDAGVVIEADAEVERQVAPHRPRVLAEHAEHLVDVHRFGRGVELLDVDRRAARVVQIHVAENLVGVVEVEPRELHAALEQVIAGHAWLAVRQHVVELDARVRLLLVARRRELGRVGRSVDHADGVGRRVRLVAVVGLALHDAERRLEHRLVVDAGVLRLRRRRRVGLDQRGDVGHEIRRRVAAMAANLVVPVVGERHLLVRRRREHALARVVLQRVVVDRLRAVVVPGADQLVDDPAPHRAVDPQPVLDQRAAAGEVQVVAGLRRVAEREPAARRSGCRSRDSPAADSAASDSRSCSCSACRRATCCRRPW